MQLPAEIEVEIKKKLSDKGYNEKQKLDWFRYFKESFIKENDKNKSINIADIRFNHKYSFSKQYNRYKLKDEYIERKITKVKL